MEEIKKIKNNIPDPTPKKDIINGKGDAPRPYSNYDKYLRNFDKIFHYDELEIGDKTWRLDNMIL